MNGLAQLMADLVPVEGDPKCPKCGGQLITHISCYPMAIVSAQVSRAGSGWAIARSTRRVVETKAQMLDASDAGDRLEGRDEVHCINSSYGRDQGCDYWIHAADLEAELVEKAVA